MSFSDLPTLNACLNGLSATFLAVGYYHIRRKREDLHRRCMLAAFLSSVLFLVGYLTYHTYIAYYLGRGPTRFVEPAWFRPYYLAILLSHTLLAALIVPMAIGSVYLGLRGRRERHARLSRWTWPIWMYVSITGVLIYLLLYQIFPQTPPTRPASEPGEEAPGLRAEPSA
jgi:uncharacterized membrane protein YozB (DUF420 family)